MLGCLKERRKTLSHETLLEVDALYIPEVGLDFYFSA